MPRILIIDDDDELRWLLGRMLVAAGYRSRRRRMARPASPAINKSEAMWSSRIL